LDTKSSDSRYDDQIQLFGQRFQKEVLGNLRLFLVGSGAIGCEMLKNWAMMGVACEGDKGLVVITDPDKVRYSSLKLTNPHT